MQHEVNKIQIRSNNAIIINFLINFSLPFLTRNKSIYRGYLRETTIAIILLFFIIKNCYFLFKKHYNIINHFFYAVYMQCIKFKPTNMFGQKQQQKCCGKERVTL